jgi:hypothetical protein
MMGGGRLEKAKGKDGKAIPRKGGKSLENQKIDRFKPKT